MLWLAFGLIAVLIVGTLLLPGSSGSLRQSTRPLGVRPRQGGLFAALRPDFGQFSFGRATTQTFHMLIAGMTIFGIVIILWAAAAGVMRTAWLLEPWPNGAGFGLAGPHGLNLLCGKSCNWPQWLLLLTQLIRAVGGVLLIGLAAGLVGALLGFLFGIPRPISANEAPPAGAGGAVANTSTSRRQAGKAWELSTNLTQISDWLTKIIVGVGLVEAKSFWGAFQSLAEASAGWIFGERHGSPAVVLATIIGSLVFGFLFAYLYTELIIARLIAATDQVLGQISVDTMRTMQSIESWNEGLVPRISRSAHAPEPLTQPTWKQVQAALSCYAITFNDLVADANVTAEEILTWARAKAVLNDYAAAAPAYLYLLGMQAP